jgi:hypothetical protein
MSNSRMPLGTLDCRKAVWAAVAGAGTVAVTGTNLGAWAGATNALKLLEVTDGKPAWRRDIRGPPVLAKDATWSEAAVV